MAFESTLSSIKDNIKERMLLKEKRTYKKEKSPKSITLFQQRDTRYLFLSVYICKMETIKNTSLYGTDEVFKWVNKYREDRTVSGI